MQTSKRFNDRVVFVTGASNGIGLAAAMAFAKEGAQLALLDIEADALHSAAHECEQTGSPMVLPQVADISSRSAVEAAVSSAAESFGHIDILINNAGIMLSGALFEQTDDMTWNRTFQVNVMGVVNCSRAIIPIMKEQRFGRIINAASMYGMVPQPLRAPYCASKAAIITITQVLAGELGPYGITVNAYAPGTVKTRMSGAAVEGPRAADKLREIPMGRFGEPEEVASAVLFLASDEAVYVNGSVLLIDGGRLAVQSPNRIWATVPEDLSIELFSR